MISRRKPAHGSPRTSHSWPCEEKPDFVCLLKLSLSSERHSSEVAFMPITGQSFVERANDLSAWRIRTRLPAPLHSQYLKRHKVSGFRAGWRKPPGSSQTGLRPKTGGLTPPRSGVSTLTARGLLVPLIAALAMSCASDVLAQDEPPAVKLSVVRATTGGVHFRRATPPCDRGRGRGRI